jgi:ribosomal protein S18 acetylase RimI-like enzyme
VTRKKKERKDGKQIHYRIRPANKEDYGFIRKLSRDIFSEFGEYDEIIPQWLVNPDVITAISRKKRRLLGFVMLYTLSGEIVAIAVSPEYQRKGIGSALLNYIECIASRYGITRLLLHTAMENELAQSFFKKVSFKVMGEEGRYYPRGQTALIMYKEI